jgi:peptidoglycan hydrolase-like protein with peptidoglycan-binding domain
VSALPRPAHFAADPLLEACRSGTATLHADVAGAAVAKVQQALMELGYALRDHGPDGVFGRETGAAVAAFNADAGLAAEAMVGGPTLAALDARLAAGRPDPPEGPAARTASSPLRPTAMAGPSPPPPTATTAAGAESAAAAAEYASRAVDAALAQAANGAHFLAGAAGARPGGTDGTRLRSAGVTIVPGRTDPADPAVFAAACGAHVCAGRCNARNGGIAGGRPAASTDTDLIVYLAGLAALPEDRWKPFFQFFSPRRFQGGMFGSQLVWGEDCRAKRHFDGAGLVNWCMEEAVEACHPIAFDLATWATDASGTEEIPLTEPPRKGDLVLRALDGAFTHIGFLVGDHDPAVSADLGHVVLAEQAGVGVVRRRFSPAGWSLRRRPSPALLRGGQ